ncbi:conserved hypothetical protein; putative signal peptide [Methylocella silvestris BL2]|uniref:Uncharacterized protein n=1 Tax=Methylocella silvestris (strain DSM 15510 / CIP 108128 / LMG 27833 / NCIMB 13906 / BL2) TaxID=395965 RepID=B8EK99_METSB|nr:hypothetical protein [Methylocella silvestris]ACK50639.1 conserved hypothetical protein; putative signal peptide [Methylocella silvestris BL2]
MSYRSELRRLKGRLIAISVLSALFGAAFMNPGAAQTVRKDCSEKYQAAKAAGTLNGLAWPQFYSQCAAEAKAGAAAAAPAAAPAAPVTAAPAAPAAPANPLKPAATTAAKPAAPAAPVAAGAAVFPSAISAAYANEKPGKQRMKTCLDQYHANKATGGNAGLRWIEKGGGYYSQCNARLKG